MKTEAMQQSLYSGVWGTIGPRFQEACKLLGERQNGAFACLMHSATAAYEAVLRSLGIAHGDQVLCAAYSHRMDAEVAAAVGGLPVFADLSAGTMAISAEAVEAALLASGQIRALMVDASGALDLAAMKRICRERSCALIVNGAEALDTVFDYDGIYAVVFDLELCGAAVTGDEKTYVSLFGWHHCGHAPGTAESFSFDAIPGGDMRITEWQAIEAMEILRESHPGRPVSERGYMAAWEIPAFRTAYFRKMTGAAAGYDAKNYPNALAACRERK